MIVFEWQEELASTADVLCARARTSAALGGQAAHGVLLAAGRQTRGRGRGSAEAKPFYSPPGGCYMSLLLRRDAYPCLRHPPSCKKQEVPCHKQDLSGLLATPRTALAARRVLTRHGCSVGIKWVNDLFLAGKKIGGILVQLVGDYAAISVGINLYRTEAPPPHLQDSIAWCFDAPVCPKLFAQELAEEIMEICAGQNNTTLLDEYREASIVLGQKILVEESSLWKPAMALDITSTGGLLIRDENGRERVLTSGSIALLG